MQLAQRMQAVQSPIIPIVGEWIRQHSGTISLGQGIVHYPPPPQALAMLSQFLADPHAHKYHAVDGIAPLREALRTKLQCENVISVTDDNAIVVTAGGNMAFFHALTAIVDPGDEVILPTPYYFNHEMALAMLNARPVLVPTCEDYQLDVTRLEAAITPRTRAIVTVSPNNPTGAVYSAESLTAVNALCRAHDLYHIHDEAYEYFVYDGARHFSPASLPDTAAHTISLYSLSKAYGFASWRIGYAVLPAALLTAFKKAQDTTLICPPVISQYAAIGALAAGRAYCDEQIARFAEVRSVVQEQLRSIRDVCHVSASQGALYFLLNINTKLDEVLLAERLVREFGVAAIPGAAFGIERGCTLRISYGALNAQTVIEGIGRLTRGLQQIVRG